MSSVRSQCHLSWEKYSAMCAMSSSMKESEEVAAGVYLSEYNRSASPMGAGKVGVGLIDDAVRTSSHYAFHY